MVLACVITARKVFYCVNPDAFDRMFLTDRTLVCGCVRVETLVHIIQWNLDITNLYVTKSSV